MIKAIDTEYEGDPFRSRLEARWAVFFKQMGVEYEYEKQGYQLNDGSWYLPDFWIKKGIEGISYVEIKPEKPKHEEMSKCELLAKGLGQNVLLLYGKPWFTDHELGSIYWRTTDYLGHIFIGNFVELPYQIQAEFPKVRFSSPEIEMSFTHSFNGEMGKIYEIIELEKQYYVKTYQRDSPFWKYGPSIMDCAFVEGEDCCTGKSLLSLNFEVSPEHGMASRFFTEKIMAAYRKARMERFGR